jgi:peptidoglycan/LPS O-acetylase OafA/YrhL
MVVVAHALALSVRADPPHPLWADDAVALLSNGVWLFFALSGYLISGSFLRALADGPRRVSTSLRQDVGVAARSASRPTRSTLR